MTAEPAPVAAAHHRSLGFWRSWSMTVGCMIGSGVFLLPSVLAPYGSISFGGWIVTSLGAIFLALTLARLATRTERAGGPYAFAHQAFGSFTGYLVGWGYWVSTVFAVTAIAVAFAGYFSALLPGIADSSAEQAAVAAGLIWTMAAVNMRGIGEAAAMQLLTTLLKLLPLVGVALLGFGGGSVETLPAFNPLQMPVTQALAATALLTMWAFIGIDAAAIPAADVINPTKTIPLALIAGTLTVAIVYMTSTAAVMMLVPADRLAVSASPFADAAASLGAWGPPVISLGALVATAGALNGNLFLAGQMPMAIALDGLAPKILGRRNRGNAPGFALLLSALLSTALLALNYGGSLVSAFQFLISMSTLAVLAPYAVVALADIRYSWKRARPWVAIGGIAIAYSVMAMLGSGLEVLLWGSVLLAAGIPVYFAGRRT